MALPKFKEPNEAMNSPKLLLLRMTKSKKERPHKLVILDASQDTSMKSFRMVLAIIVVM